MSFATFTSGADDGRLREYAQGSASVCGAEVASTVCRIAERISCAGGITPESRDAARHALVKLACEPQPDALPALLTICEIGISLQVVDAFLLSSLAWKAVVPTCQKFSGTGCIPPQVRLRTPLCAILSAKRLLYGIRRSGNGSSPDPSGLSSAPLKAVKISRFHCSNAAKCAKAFAEGGQWDASSEESLCQLLAAVLELSAYVLFLISFEESVTEELRHELQQSVCHGLGATLRFVLSIVSTFRQSNDVKDASAILCRAVDQIPEIKDDSSVAPSISQGGLQLLANLHLMRYAVSETPKEDTVAQSDPPGHSDEPGPFLCSDMLISELLPRFFQRLATEHKTLLVCRHAQTALQMPDVLCAAVEEWVLTAEANSDASCLDRTRILEELLLSQLTSSAATPALMAMRIILRIAGAEHSTAQRRQQLLILALRATRISLSVCPGHAERRWIPLAAALGHEIMKRNEDLEEALRTYQADNVQSASEIQTEKTVDLQLGDPVVLRVTAALCGKLIAEETENGSALVSPQRAEENVSILDRVVHSLGLNRPQLVSFVKDVVLGNKDTGATAEAALYLIPYLMDARASSGAALVCLKREESSIRIVQRAFNILNPAVMSPSATRTACNQASALIRKFGATICPPVTAFVARAAHSLRSTVPLSDWHYLSSLLNLAVSTLQPSGSEELGNRLRYAVLLSHTARVLHAISLSQNSDSDQSTRPMLPKPLMALAEEAQERLQRWYMEMKSSGTTKNFGAEDDIICREATLHSVKPRFNAPENGLTENGTVTKRLEEIKKDLLRTCGKAVHPQAIGNVGNLKKQIAEFRNTLWLLEETL